MTSELANAVKDSRAGEAQAALVHCGRFSRAIESAPLTAQNPRQEATKGDRSS